MSTKHIGAASSDFADTVLMPGDPLRAKYIAEKFLHKAVLVNDVRNMLAYTGQYHGQRISVMGHGMGIPSTSIYCTELIRDFNVRQIIRVGSCGSVNPDILLRDIIIAMGACTDSAVNRIRFKGYDFAAIADFELARTAADIAASKGLRFHIGNVFSADLFYTPDEEMFDVMARYGILGVEMEAAGLYGLAAEFGARALCICTVSDHIRSGEALSPAERETTFDDMIDLALAVVAETP